MKTFTGTAEEVAVRMATPRGATGGDSGACIDLEHEVPLGRAARGRRRHLGGDPHARDS